MSEAAQRRALAEFGRRVRAHRIKIGLSQEALAHRAGIHPSYQGGVERGDRNLGLVNLLRIANALGVDPGSLVEGISLRSRRS
jgi:transcriptional regulator with XRE-family HTH domain